ncbi:MAG TPA: hypothetical protein RMH85_36210 [Polyangiaceae bacterium LLY-WYZ-15_(1-7)]|nr:hypothetical protein [Myxococcales bacterium]MAT29173.1 hypothetical protein [Sandaracinus sp.]HJK90388.1 hypothetical protein [Polyangiaceae bacterium LLY-WYZ-15_(1-7)]HJL03428.1 hypothetical protein [Polyangiaceae bacterium LLY-WYZ-15_(1-7)]HJL13987.1 hypothetical protein [Polyangiaceae bacterium LLY-WYZ-15_(1-7)]
MADEHHDEGGVLPEIHDEAADTPMWVPVLGLSLLALAAIFLIVRAAFADADAEGALEAAPSAAQVEAAAR